MNRSKTAILVLLASPLGIYGATATLTNTLNANVGALGALAAPSTAALTNTGTIFNAYTGMVALQYRARTSAAGGGALTMKVTQDFQTGGPSVAAGDLTYQCGSASLGTACAATTASTSTATQVVTLPPSAFYQKLSISGSGTDRGSGLCVRAICGKRNHHSLGSSGGGIGHQHYFGHHQPDRSHGLGNLRCAVYGYHELLV